MPCLPVLCVAEDTDTIPIAFSKKGVCVNWLMYPRSSRVIWGLLDSGVAGSRCLATGQRETASLFVRSSLLLPLPYGDKYGTSHLRFIPFQLSPPTVPTGSWCILPQSSSMAPKIPHCLGLGLESASECCQINQACLSIYHWGWSKEGLLLALGKGQILKGEIEGCSGSRSGPPFTLDPQDILSSQCLF